MCVVANGDAFDLYMPRGLTLSALTSFSVVLPAVPSPYCSWKSSRSGCPSGSSRLRMEKSSDRLFWMGVPVKGLGSDVTDRFL